MKQMLASLLLLLCCVTGCARHWTGTFATAVERPLAKSDMPRTALGGNTLREVVRVSIGGDRLRVKLSNEFGDSAVDIRAVYISLTPGSAQEDGGAGAIIPSSAKYLSFHGKRSVSIASGKAVWSDAVAFALKPLQLVAVTITYGKTLATMTTHRGSRTNSYIALGEVAPWATFRAVEVLPHWYSIASISVETPDSGNAIAILGNSITDGRGSTTDAQNRWPDRLAEALGGTAGVLNLGIGGNCVVSGGLGEPGVVRFRRDVLSQDGVGRVVIFQGTNDIGGCRDAEAGQTVRRLIAAYKALARQAHDRGLKVYGATITPFRGSGSYSARHEAARQAVNGWIRTAADFDGVIDFDACVRDPRQPDRLLEEYSDDWLHLNPKGYEAMGRYAARQIKSMEAAR